MLLSDLFVDVQGHPVPLLMPLLWVGSFRDRHNFEIKMIAQLCMAPVISKDKALQPPAGYSWLETFYNVSAQRPVIGNTRVLTCRGQYMEDYPLCGRGYAWWFCI